MTIEQAITVIEQNLVAISPDSYLYEALTIVLEQVKRNDLNSRNSERPMMLKQDNSDIAKELRNMTKILSQIERHLRGQKF